MCILYIFLHPSVTNREMYRYQDKIRLYFCDKQFNARFNIIRRSARRERNRRKKKSDSVSETTR